MHHCIAEEVAQIALPVAAVRLGQVDQSAPDNYISKHIDFLLPRLHCRHYIGVCGTRNNEGTVRTRGECSGRPDTIREIKERIILT